MRAVAAALIVCFLAGCGSGADAEATSEEASISSLELSPDELARLNEAVKEGDRLWDEAMGGVEAARDIQDATTSARSSFAARRKFDDAYERYMVVVNASSPLPDRGVMARVYGRVIDVAVARKRNPALATEVAKKALQRDIFPITTSEDASSALEAARRAIKAEEQEIDDWLESQQRTSRSQEGRLSSGSVATTLMDMEDRYQVLVEKIRPGMSPTQVAGVLGQPDEKKANGLGEFNPQKRGQRLEIWTWREDAAPDNLIMLSFVDGVLSEGGTSGYDIRKGFE